ncbi:MAG TPA: ABC transporter substrate-binding protein [Thermoanaerobaculia bacterium]|nr:ABC transporter substrate-binding protein [Thermoanaerobaculia bacterium]
MSAQRRSNVFLIVLSFVVLSSGCAQPPAGSGKSAESILDRVKREGVIHAAFIKYPPFVDVDPRTHQPSGYFIDVMEEVRSRMGKDMKLSYEETTWGTMVAGVQSKRFDVVVSGIFSTIPRSMEVTFSRPLLFVGLGAVSRATDTRFATEGDLQKPGLTVAVTAGEVGHEYAQKYLPTAKLIVIDTPDITRPMLEVLSGRADIGIADSMSCYNFVAAHQGDAKQLFADHPLYVYSTTLMLPRHEPDWKDFLDQSLAFLDYSGITKRLEAKYKKGSTAWISRSLPFAP